MNSNDIALNHDDVEFLNEPLPFLPADLFPSTDDMLTLNKQIELLNLDMNTQSLKVEVEKLKRRKSNETRTCLPTPI